MGANRGREEEFARKLAALMEQCGVVPGELDSKWREFLNEHYRNEGLFVERLKMTGYGDDDPALRAFPEVTLESLSSYMTDVLADCRLFNYCYDELVSPGTVFSAEDLVQKMGLGEPCFLSRFARDCFRASLQLYEVVRFTQESYGEDARVVVEPANSSCEGSGPSILEPPLPQFAERTRQVSEDLIQTFDGFISESPNESGQAVLASLDRLLLDMLALQALAVESGPFWSKASYEIAEPVEMSVKDGKLQIIREPKKP